MDNKIKCNDFLPSNTAIFPQALRDQLDNDLNLQSFDIAITTNSSLTIRNFWIVGCVLLPFLIAAYAFSMFGSVLINCRMLRIIIYVVLGLGFCIPLIVPAAVLRTLMSKAADLPS